MPRRSRTASARDARARAAAAGGGAARTASPFEALAHLGKTSKPTSATHRAPAGGGGNAPKLPEADRATKGDTVVEAEDVALFLKANANTRPLAHGGRLELERPRPEPIPRFSTLPQAEDEPMVRRAVSDALRAAYEDVTPLKDTGRVMLDTPARHRDRSLHAQEKTAYGAVAEGPAALPSDVDANDPNALFRYAMSGAKPIDTRNRVVLERPSPAPSPIKREADERAALTESLNAPLSFEDRLDMGDEAAFLRTGLPRRVLSDLRRGRWVLQGQIDLHGLTRDEAREALGHFLTTSLQQGHRCIRVIHGKGLGSPGRVSILKQLSRGWLAQREEILAFCQAGPHDGGAGALLVLMRAQNAARD